METQVKDDIDIRNNVYCYLFPYNDCRVVFGSNQLEVVLRNKLIDFIPAILVWSKPGQTFNERKASV